MNISIVMPVSRADTIQKSIQSIINQDWTHWEIIAVGQGSLQKLNRQRVKETVEYLQGNDSRVNYLHIKKQGATAARNAGVAAARGDVIAMIDDDCEAREDWLSVIVRFFESNPTVDFVGGALVAPPSERSWFSVCPSNHPSESIYDPIAMEGIPPAGWEWISANIAMRKEVAERVGPWDELIGPGTIFPAADDTDFKLRMEKVGIRMATTPRLVVNHTYGYRYGLGAMIKFQYGYAYGNGGLAGKLTLNDDPRGKEWLNSVKEECFKTRRLIRPYLLARSIWRYRIFTEAYEWCLQNLQVRNGLLQPIKSTPSKGFQQTDFETLSSSDSNL